MSREAVEEILSRAIEDDGFRDRLLHSPAEALEGYDLSLDERQALIAGDLRKVLQAVERQRSP